MGHVQFADKSVDEFKFKEFLLGLLPDAPRAVGFEDLKDDLPSLFEDVLASGGDLGFITETAHQSEAQISRIQV